jgi:tRNA-specific 2-thiouridylase
MVGEELRVIVAMSGGVDSSVAVALLLEQGYEVIGLTLRLWPGEEEQGAAEDGCCGLGGVTAARAAADVLGIPHYVVDAHARFERLVLRPAWEAYQRGRTPNPCVTCNRAIKLDLLQEHASRLDARLVATGHHARLERTGPTGLALLRGRDPEKDQSYFLFRLGPAQLAQTLLPVGRLTKAEVRQRARELGLPNAKRKESQDACLDLGQQGFAETLRRHFDAPPRPGAIVDRAGRPLGQHDGIHCFTIGQRKGLGVARGQRAYVTAIHAGRGEVTISEDVRDLETEMLVATELSWLVPPPAEPFEAEVQIRYRHRPARARVSVDAAGHATVCFAEPQRAVTPGQAAVFYRGEQVLGGGWIAGANEEEA